MLGLYRSMLKTIRQVPDDADRKYLRNWAREEFQRNKNASNQVCIPQAIKDFTSEMASVSHTSCNVSCFDFFQDAIRMMITQANMHLDDLRKSLALAKS